MAAKNLAIIFGGKSPEHDVSIVSFFQIWPHIDSRRYRRFPIYLDFDNQAYLAPFPDQKNFRHFIDKTLERHRQVRFVRGGLEIKRLLGWKKVLLDSALLLLHGSYGEDGRLQGFLDFLDIPYTGSGVLGSALGMDKVAMKDIFIRLGLPVTPYLWFWFDEFRRQPKVILAKIKKELTGPIFVKPANAGSSIGITRVIKKKDLTTAIRRAARFDKKILVEQEIKNAVDINCAIMGGFQPLVSACEQPLSDDKFFSFHEKYLKGGKKKGLVNVSRIVPAPLPPKTTQRIQEMSKLIFRELDCWGVARMDFLYQERTGKVYPNEINTIPGSLAFYLWEAAGIKPRQLVNRLLHLARQRYQQQQRLHYSFASPLLDQK